MTSLYALLQKIFLTLQGKLLSAAVPNGALKKYKVCVV